MRIPFLTNQDSMESRIFFFFFVAPLRWIVLFLVVFFVFFPPKQGLIEEHLFNLGSPPFPAVS